MAVGGLERGLAVGVVGGPQVVELADGVQQVDDVNPQPVGARGSDVLNTVNVEIAVGRFGRQPGVQIIRALGWISYPV